MSTRRRLKRRPGAERTANGATKGAKRVQRRPRSSDTAIAVGARVRQLRLAAGLSQAELAGEGLSRFAISKIETGASLPSLDALLHLARVLGVSPGTLIPPEL